jgi:hypothetical protein
MTQTEREEGGEGGRSTQDAWNNIKQSNMFVIGSPKKAGEEISEWDKNNI